MLSMEGTNVFVIGLWDEYSSSALLSTSSSSPSLISNHNNSNGLVKRLPPIPPIKTSSCNRRLSKLVYDTTCFISEDGKALVCESDLPASSSSHMQKRSNSMLFQIRVLFINVIIMENISHSLFGG